MFLSPITRSVCSSAFKSLERSTGLLICTDTGNTSSKYVRSIFTLSHQYYIQPLPAAVLHNYQPSREYAARKGTRARKEAKKTKKVEVKRPFILKNLRKLAKIPYKPQRPIDDSNKELPIDNVYFIENFRAKRHSFEEALQCLREGNHPTMANNPGAALILRVDLDLKLPNRATKCLDRWKSIIEMKRPFLLEGMAQPAIMAFCMEDLEYIENVKKGGADIAGGKELIKAIQAGEVSTEPYEFIVAHPSIVNDLTAIRGLIKKKFPTVKAQTINTDLVPQIQRLKSGIKIQVVTNDQEPDYGYIETPIGSLDMEGLIENYHSVIRDTLTKCPKNKDKLAFLIGCSLKTTGPHEEQLKLDVVQLLEELEGPKPTENSDEAITAAASS